MTSGLTLNESYQFKRMIHGIHGNSKRAYPFTHGNPVYGAFNKSGVLSTTGTAAYDFKLKDGTPVKAGATVAAGQGFANWLTGNPPGAPPENYAAEVAYPDLGINCNACHVNNSYQTDRSTVGAVVSKPPSAGTNPLGWLVITPKAASCTACHDSSKAIGHVTSFGGSSFGNLTQNNGLLTLETCADCHSSGQFKGVDIVHGLK
jgi:OmcA/MtrC family decaheme c-type cytochrome